MGAYANDYLEKTWPSSYGGRGGTYGGEGGRKIANNRDGFIWDHCKRNKVSFRSYGEFVSGGKPTLDVLNGHIASYHSYDLGSYDLLLSASATSDAQIEVRGVNRLEIFDGDFSPSTGDGTDFGSVTQGSSQTRTFTIYNRGTTNLDISSVFITSSNSSFSLLTTPASSISPGSSTRFNVLFTPTGAGTLFADIEIDSNSQQGSAFQFSIQGTSPSISDDVPGIETIGFPGFVTRKIDFLGDVDVFEFFVPSRRLVVIQTNGISDTEGFLTNAAGRTIAFNDDSGAKRNFKITKRLNRGFYRIEVSNYRGRTTGNYQLSVR